MDDWRHPEFRAALKAHLASYAGADARRATREIGLTFIAYAAFLSTTALALRELLDAASWPARGGWLGALIFSGAALALVQTRAFLVHHDLCHGSLFVSPRWNRALAPLVGTLVSTSPSVWKREHDRHHRDSNNLDRPQDGQTAPWTVQHYETAPRWQRRAYWLLNQRPVLFGLVPPLYFLGFMRVAARWYENVLFALFIALLWWSGTLPAFALVLTPATIFGFLIFHAQHTGPTLVRRHTADYDPIENGLFGSTLLLMPRVPGVTWFIDWCLYGVEYHHVHHLHPALPAWRQRACHEAGARFFADTPRITFWEAMKATRLTLYDEAAGHLVDFNHRG